MSQTLVTVAIPFFNSRSTLHYAVESVLSQEFQDFELLLVDDGSADGSADLADLFTFDKRVRVLRHNDNLGLAPRLNQITQEARGEYIARMDSDDIMHPARLRRQLEHLRANREIDVLGTSVYLIDGAYCITGRKDTRLVRLCAKFAYRSLFHPSVTGRTTWFRSNPYSSQFLRCEDGELWLRSGGGPNIDDLREPLLYYNRCINFDLAKTCRSLRQYQQILQLHSHRTCVFCRARETAYSHARIAGYSLLTAAGMIDKVVHVREDALSANDRQCASKPLDMIRQSADDRLQSARRCTVSVPATPAACRPGVQRQTAPLVWASGSRYGTEAPFHPPAQYPELARVSGGRSGDNPVYGAVRDMFSFLMLDAEHLGTPEWNPLGKWIRPGMRVVIKPNWVKHEIGYLEGAQVLCTNPSLVRVLTDYALVALKGEGEVAVCDSPLQGSDFQRYRRQSGIDRLQEHYESLRLPVTFCDLRMEWAEVDDESSFITRKHRLAGDPHGYSIVNLGRNSRLAEVAGGGSKFAVTDYRSDRTNGHHDETRHEYCISNTVLRSDVLINLPKLKTHIKSGITGALKNMIGINCSKDYLPHFRQGSPSSGGDEYPDGCYTSWLTSQVRNTLQGRAPLWLWRGLRNTALRHTSSRTSEATVVQGGGWHGNDTLWRTIHDVVSVARHYDAGGTLRDTPRPMLTLIDAMVAGEGSGPLQPVPRNAGLLIWGEDPGTVDIAAATAMGFDWKHISMLAHLADEEAKAITSFDGDLSIQTPTSVLKEQVLSGTYAFESPAGWRGTIELPARDEVTA